MIYEIFLASPSTIFHSKKKLKCFFSGKYETTKTRKELAFKFKEGVIFPAKIPGPAGCDIFPSDSTKKVTEWKNSL